MVDSRAMPYTFGGLKIYIDNNAMVDVVEDWSNVRSKGRAARRRKRGFAQNIKISHVPKKQAFVFEDKVFMHHDFYMLLMRKMDEDERPKDNYSSPDISFRFKPESEVSEHNEWGNSLWIRGIGVKNLSWIYSANGV